MRQSSLSAFCSLPPSRRHFVLDENYHAHFLEKPPSTASHVSDTMVSGQALRVTLSLWRTDETSKVFTPIVNTCDKSLMASMIQKAVRRGEADVAASAALELSHVSPTTLARRLTIIAIEDVSADANLVTIVWLMLVWSSNSAQPVYEEDICYMVKYAEALATHSHRVKVDSHAPVILSDRALWNRAQARCDDTSLALIVRSTYGGMAGDMRMLLRASEQSLVDAPRLVFSTTDVPRLKKEQCILAAADFHCEPKMLEELAAIHETTADAIKDAIWQNSSCLNFRMRVDPTPASRALWSLIADDARTLQQRRIARAFSKRRDSDST